MKESYLKISNCLWKKWNKIWYKLWKLLYFIRITITYRSLGLNNNTSKCFNCTVMSSNLRILKNKMQCIKKCTKYLILQL